MNRRLAAMGIAGVAAAFCAGCTSGGDRSAPPSSNGRSTTTTSTLACSQGSAAAPSTSTSEECAAAEFHAALAQSTNPQVEKLSEARSLLLGENLCGYAAQLGHLPTTPTFDDVMESTAASWKLSKTATKTIAQAAVTLCPADMRALLALEQVPPVLEVTYRVTGSGDVTVTYTTGEGSFGHEVVTAPWSRKVELHSTRSVSLLATPRSSSSGPVVCSIDHHGKAVDTESGDPADGGTVACNASIDANGQLTASAS